MNLTPIPATVGADRCIVRGQRLVQVKFVALPFEPETRDRPQLRSKRRLLNGIVSFIHRVIGRLVAARP